VKVAKKLFTSFNVLLILSFKQEVIQKRFYWKPLEHYPCEAIGMFSFTLARLCLRDEND
jgi:hypothetical protein